MGKDQWISFLRRKHTVAKRLFQEKVLQPTLSLGWMRALLSLVRALLD